MADTAATARSRRTWLFAGAIGLAVALSAQAALVLQGDERAVAQTADTNPCDDFLISGPDGRVADRHQTVVQVFVTPEICELEQRVLAGIAADRGLTLTPDVRAEILAYGRSEVRTQLLLELVRIIDMAPSERDATEQGALDWWAARYRSLRVDAAAAAEEEYATWAANPCAYSPPGDFEYNVAPEQCTDLASLFTGGPRPPKYEDFVAFGLDRATGGALESEFAVDYLAGMLTALAITSSSIGTTAAIALPFAFTTIAKALFPYKAKAGAAFTGVFGGSLVATVVFAIVVIAVVVSITRGVQVVRDSRIPGRLLIDSTLAGIVGEPQLTSALTSETEVQQVLAAYLFAVSPDVLPPTLPAMPTAPTLDARRFVTRKIVSGAVADSTGPSFEIITSDGRLQRVWMKDHWFVVEPVDGSTPAVLQPALTYLSADGRPVTATFDGENFVVVQIDGSVEVSCDTGVGCLITDTLDYVIEADDDAIVAVAKSRYVGRPPVIASGPTVSGELTEGNTITLSVDATDPEGEALTYRWRLSRGPVTATIDGGASVDHVLLGGGDYEVSVTVTDPQGGETTAGTTVSVVTNTALVGTRTLHLLNGSYREQALVEITPGRFEVTATPEDRVRVDWDGDGVDDAQLIAGSDGIATFDTPAFPEGITPVGVAVDAGDGTPAITAIVPIDVINARPQDLVLEVYHPDDGWQVRPAIVDSSAPRAGRPTFYEGDVVLIRASAFDPGNDPLEFTIYQRNGTRLFDYGFRTQSDNRSGTIEAAIRFPNQLEYTSHPFFGDNPMLLATAIDQGLGSTARARGSDRAFFHVDNLPPEIEQVVQDADNAGQVDVQVVASDPAFAYLDVERIEIDWGDGSAPVTADFGRILGELYLDNDVVGSASHRYTTPGSYTATITVFDDVTSVTEDVEIVVPAFAPVVEDIVDLEVGPERSPTTIGAEVSDVDTELDEVTVTFDWGDGNTSPGVLTDGTFRGSHDYQDAGDYLVTIDANDGVLDAEPFEGRVIVADAELTVTIEQGASQDDPTLGDVAFDVVFSEPVTGFEASDVELSGTAGATDASVTDTGNATSYTVVVSGMTSTGTVTASLPAGAAENLDGGPSLASVSADNTVEFVAPLQIQVPTAADVSVDNDPGLDGATVSFDVGVSGGSGAATVECAPPSGSFFPIGTTAVECTAVDGAAPELRVAQSLLAPEATASFVVDVRDVEAPTLAPGPTAPTVISSPDGSPVVVEYVVPEGDDNSATVEVVCSPPSGSLFEIGSTTITCTATDATGNSSVTTFEIVVEDTSSTTEPSVPPTAPTAASPADPAPTPAANPSGSPFPPAGIATTGSNVLDLLLSALAALLIGLVLVVSARRQLRARPAGPSSTG